MDLLRRGRRRTIAGLAVAAITATALTPTASAAAAATVVSTDKGAVRGVAAGGLRSFRGIPYAAPPGRWSSPGPAAPWSGVREATDPGPACAQPAGLPVGVPSEHEDCLYLNVTTPGRRGDRRPVIVWIHGGSLMYGAGDLYRADRLAADAVVVSMNYRLGVLSFLTHPDLDAGTAYGSGSLALEDQQAALRWVRANIGAFGGDPANVTIMGQSGGGYAVCDHLASPMSAGLFHRAIVQSAPCAGGGASRTRAQAEAESARLLRETGCPDVACLRKAPIADLLAAYGTDAEPRPVAGTPLLPLDPVEALRTGRFHRVPVLLGVNHDEENGRYALAPPAAEEYPALVRAQFGSAADAVLARYPLSAYGGSAGLALAAIGTDRSWAVPTYDTATLLARWTPTTVYEFAERDTPWFNGFPEPAQPWGAQHMAEIAYLFDMDLFRPRTPAQDRLADRLVHTWTRFAAGDAAWPSFTGHRPHIQSLTSGRWQPTGFRRDHEYDFWSDLT